MARSTSAPRPVGYEFLSAKYKLSLYPFWVESSVGTERKSVHQYSGRSVEVFPKKYWPGGKDVDHLNFALNREGIHLELLTKLMPKLSSNELEQFISNKPTGANGRRIWFLYEEITGNRLNLPDLDSKVGKYIPLLDPKKYYTGPNRVSQRHRVKTNLLGTLRFAAFVRKTDELKDWEDKDLENSCAEFIRSISPDLFERVRDYLYTKETKSSYAIERLKPDSQRAVKFAQLLSEAGNEEYLKKDALINLQTRIVDPKFAVTDYRHEEGEQVYVGESISITDQKVHFVAPKQDDIADLMDDYLEASHLILESSIHPVISAALISYIFVFLHPFPDGNGRIHRFLIHHALSKLGFAPEGIIFPVSAIMLNRSRDYDESLERYSRDLMPLIEYELDDFGRMTVLNETGDYYRYIDLTSICGFLFSFVEETIEEEMPAEVEFLTSYDKARTRLRDVLDMPNRIADLFVRLCLQNDGQLSKNKRKLAEFEGIDEPTILEMEKAVRGAFGMEDKN